MLPMLVKQMLQWAISAAMGIIIAAIVISWLRVAGVRIPYYHPVVRAIEQSYEAMMRPIRRTMPTSVGGLDFAPMVALIVLNILRRVIALL